MQTIINPLVVSVGPTNEATITPVPMTHHGGGVKKAIAVVAMGAIPIAAPAIASSIAASGVLGAAISGAMATTAGAVVSSAIVGAGLGAITAKVTGGDVKAGAISGLIGGGIGGYGARAGFGQPTPVANTSTTATTLSGGNVAGSGVSTTPDGLMNASLTTGGGTGVEQAGLKTGTSTLDTAASGGFIESMKQGLSKAGEQVVSKITNPDTLANAVLQVGGALAGEAIVGTPGMTPEEQQAIEQYKQELQTLRARDEQAFNQKMDAAKQYMVQAGYYDPNYFALQSANRTAIAEGRKLREFERKAGLTSGGVSQGDRRRAALSGGANIQSAFDRGFLTGQNLQNQVMSTGVGLIPSAPKGGVIQASGLVDVASQMGNIERAEADRKKSAISGFFGKFNTASGLTKDQEEERNKKASAGLNTGNMPVYDMKKNLPEQRYT